MQNKGVIRFFAIVFGLVCLYQLSFTWVVRNVESDAADYANGDPVKERAYLDSMAAQTVYNLGVVEYSYNDCKSRELNLGLDLKGGMNVILEVSVPDIIYALSNDSKDPVFNKAMDAAINRQKNSQDNFVDLFYEEFQRVNSEESNPVQLSSPTIFGTRDLREKINIGTTDEEVIKVIREEADGAVERVYTVLRARIDKFGVVQPNIQPLENGRILVELPGVKDPDRVKRILQSTAKLEFWDTYEVSEVGGFFIQANEKLRSLIDNPKENSNQTPTDSEEDGEDSAIDDLLSGNNDTLGNASNGLDSLGVDSLANDTAQDLLNQFNPLFEVFLMNTTQDGQRFGEGPLVGYALIKDTAKVNEYINHPEVQKLLPAQLKYAKFLWGAKPIDDNETLLGLYAIKSNREGEARLEGDMVADASAGFDQLGRPVVNMTMDAAGTQVWKKMTAQASEVEPKRSVAVVLDNYVYSAPRVNGVIPNGKTEISGDFTVAETNDLSNILKTGKLPAPAKILQSEVVGPSLGQEAIQAGVTSFAIALIVVLLYMIFYYNHAGIASNVALLVNMLFIFGVLASFGAVLTLPGIAGIVLTIGMAVDANVLIYERIREETRAGKGIRLAVTDGYKNAYSSIIDANVTTLLTGIVLYVFGTGPIRGFATTLIVGILTSLFAAIFITRLIFEARLDKKKEIKFSTALTAGTLSNVNISFLQKRKTAYVISGIIILVGLGSLFTVGLNQGVDFTGGRSYKVRFDQAVSTVDLRNSLGDVLVDQDGIALYPEVKTSGSDNQVRITTKYRIDEEGADVDLAIQEKIFEGSKPFFGQEVSFEEFITDNQNKDLGIMYSTQVGPTIADDIKKDAFWALLFSLVIIFVYILLRFRKWQFSLGAVAAVFHDVLIVLSMFSLLYKFMPFSLEIDQAFIAAILTVIGYSLNDTVVVFDRIRENLNLNKKKGYMEVVNTSLNSTLSRTLNTSLTTLFVLLVIFIFGGEVIRGFMFALMVGVIVGTYSSVFIATPIMFDSSKKLEEAKTKK